MQKAGNRLKVLWACGSDVDCNPQSKISPKFLRYFPDLPRSLWNRISQHLDEAKRFGPELLIAVRDASRRQRTDLFADALLHAIALLRATFFLASSSSKSPNDPLGRHAKKLNNADDTSFQARLDIAKFNIGMEDSFLFSIH